MISAKEVMRGKLALWSSSYWEERIVELFLWDGNSFKRRIILS
jgi:hypothetical protein